MFTITKEFLFEAMHYLPALPEGHKCRRPHGHSYKVIVELQSKDLDQYGFVEDFGDLGDIRRYIDEHLDHRNLVEVFGESGNTTSAERLALALFLRFKPLHPKLAAITVCETGKTSSTFRPEPKG